MILAHLLSGARAHGIEIQAVLVQGARKRAAELKLSGISFEHANVLHARLNGSVFFLYTPFNGQMLSQVLRELERVAQRRPVVVCAVGLELRDVAWLRERRSASASVVLYDSRSV